MAHQSISHEGLPAGYDSWRTSGPLDWQGDEHDTTCPDCQGTGYLHEDGEPEEVCTFCVQGIITEPCPEHCADHCDCRYCDYRD